MVSHRERPRVIKKGRSPQVQRSRRISEENYLPSLPSKSQKRHRSLHARPLEQTFDHHIASGITTSTRCHISEWAKKNEWPKEFFERDKMQHLLAKKKPSTAPLRRKRSEASFITSTTPSDLQAEKSAPYKNPSYETVLERHAGSFMGKYRLGITATSEKLCQTLLNSQQDLPSNTIFHITAFEDACERLRGKNKARIFKDCTPLIVPSAEAHASFSAMAGLDIVIESVNEGWNNSNPITKPRPQPDYAVGFKRSAFSDNQLEKLQPFIGEPSSSSYFMGTHYMYFPFFTCEVGSAGLDIADRQNLHSMTLAVRAVVELFRLVNRAEELHREILAFSISHDHETVRIYGHFPVIEGTKVTYWRHSLRKYDFTERYGRERWTAYTFMKNVYDIWMPTHFNRISSAIDGLLFKQAPESSHDSGPCIPETPRLSQRLGDQDLVEVSDDDVQEIIPDRSTQTDTGPPKKKRKPWSLYDDYEL